MDNVYVVALNNNGNIDTDFEGAEHCSYDNEKDALKCAEYYNQLWDCSDFTVIVE